MKFFVNSSFLLIFLSLFIFSFIQPADAKKNNKKGNNIEKKIKLPDPDFKGKMSVEEAIYKRRSIRSYKKEALTLKEISQLLWSAFGINADGISSASRTFPSAGALYPIDLYLVAFNIKDLSSGIYKYYPVEHQLVLIIPGDHRKEVENAAYGQFMFNTASGVLVYSYDINKVKERYGTRGAVRYGPMDIGHSAENVYLQAQSLKIGTVAVGSFDDTQMKKLLKIKDKEVVYMLPVGKI